MTGWLLLPGESHAALGPAARRPSGDDADFCPVCQTQRKTVFSCPECPPITLCDCPSSVRPAVDVSRLVIAAYGFVALAIALLLWVCIPGLSL